MIPRLFLAALFLTTLVACSSRHNSDSSGTSVGMEPVSFSLDRLNGGKDALNAHHGHPVLLDLWASWCPPCRQELPELSKLAAADPQLVVLSANQGESAAVAENVVRSLHLQIPVLLDHEQSYGGAYATIGLPTAVILDANGKIAAVETGAHTLPEWQAILAPVTAHVASGAKR
jgi:thiol-disulfide isomerase/thioredoxin